MKGQPVVGRALALVVLVAAPCMALAQPDPHMRQKLVPAPFPDRAEPRPGLDAPLETPRRRLMRPDLQFHPKRMRQHLLPDPAPRGVRLPAHAPLSATGFTMNTAMEAGQGGGEAPLERPNQLPQRLGACFRPPESVATRVNEVTVRLAFSASGHVLGEPRITYTNLPLADPRRADLAAAFLAGIADCAPLRFTPAMGSAIAGRIFTIRYVIAPPGKRSGA